MKIDEIVRNQWNEAAGSFIGFVRSGKNYYSEYMNFPALVRAVGEVRGKRVLDMGCGEGSSTRIFAEAGAEMTGVDFSEVMIKAAVEEEERNPLGIRYIIADAANLSMLESESFDLAFCYMTIMDIADFERAIAEAARVLKRGGRLVVVMVHPCFDTRFMDGRMVGGWEARAGEDGSKEYLYYWTEEYFTRHSCTFEWRHDRLPAPFVTTGFHRTLSDYVNAITGNGMVITGMEEPGPMEEGVRLLPGLGKHLRVPQSMVIEATKHAR
jgi:SAM-dependent methyltransferase